MEIEAYLLATVPSAKINGHSAPRLPGTTSIVIPGVPNEMLLANLSTVCVSTGAACSRGVPGISHVLAAMQMSGVEAESTIRISVGRFNTLDEVRAGGEQIAATAKSLLADLSSEVCNPWSKEATF